MRMEYGSKITEPALIEEPSQSAAAARLPPDASRRLRAGVRRFDRGRAASAEAEQMLDTAIALGAHDADVYYYQTLAISHATPDNLEDAQKAISQALALSAEDPSIRLLAGEILLKRKDYAAALDHLTAAVRLQPTSVRAHYLLRAAYRDLGDAEKSAAELQQIE